MFRKRDTDAIDNETEIDLGADQKVDDQFKAEEKPERPAKPALAQKAEPAPAPKAEPEPEPELEPLTLAEPAPAPFKEPEIAVTPVDNLPSDSDLPEIEPLSAAAKPAAASVSPAASSSQAANKRLIVGQGIRLSGEINSCDRLVVEGEVEVTLNDTLALEITSSGRFTGGCEVEEADISGIYEGDLTVRNTLFVRGTGRITGTIRYGQLELERGGQIAGNISVLGNETGSLGGGGDNGKGRGAKAPLFGGSSS